MARATCGTIRLKLFKVATALKISVHRIAVHLPSAYPFQNLFIKA